jgi:hypothetical protein
VRFTDATCGEEFLALKSCAIVAAMLSLAAAMNEH